MSSPSSFSLHFVVEAIKFLTVNVFPDDPVKKGT